MKTHSHVVPYSKLETAAQAAVEWGLQHEYQIKELEVSLRLNGLVHFFRSSLPFLRLLLILCY